MLGSFIDNDNKLRLFDIPNFKLSESGIIILDGFNNIVLENNNDVSIESRNIYELRKYGATPETTRAILINYQTGAHNARMKVSKKGKKVNPKDGYHTYAISNEGTPPLKSIDTVKWKEFKSTYKTIGMDSKENISYKELYLRNYGIMCTANDSKWVNYAGQTLLRDEYWRYQGFTVNRNKDGIAKIYNKDGSLKFSEDITGRRII